MEILVHERLAQVRRGGVSKLPAQVGLHVVERRGGDEVRRRRGKFRLAHVHAAGFLGADSGEIGVPIEAGRGLVQVGHGHLVVVGLRVAQIDARLAGLGEFGLEAEHALGFGGGYLGLVAEQHEHLADVLLVGGANLLRFFVVEQVIIAVRQAQATLAELGDVGLGILLVGPDLEVEQGHARRPNAARPAG